MAEILHLARRIDGPAIKDIADKANIRYRTLQTAIRVGRVSRAVEALLCGLCGFSPDDPCWCDPTLTEPERRIPCGPYRGTDTAAAFRQMLLSLWQPGGSDYRALSQKVEPINPFLASHGLNDCQQSTKWPLDIRLFLEACFGVVWSDDVRYGLRAVQIRLYLSDGEQGEFRILLGREQAARIGNAILRSKGTTCLPCWELARQEDGGEVLDGEYLTTEGPLVSVSRYRNGTRLVSILTANLHDGFVALDPDIGPVPANRRGVLEVICQLEVPEQHRRQGIIELCRQEILLTDITHAQTL